MNARAQVQLLPDGRRLYLHDGPIDIVLEAFGPPTEIEAAYQAATARFADVLDELCAELPILRRPAGADSPSPAGSIARRMLSAVMPYAQRTFITPMAAVAGAIAEEILGAMTEAATLERAYVNDGGDIAIHIAAGKSFVVGLVNRPDQPSLFGSAVLEAGDPVRGIATSGWRGRSFSLGIADAVTVLADRASTADAAATIIANAVDLPGHPNLVRVPACQLAPDNDLGDRLVTQQVGQLTAGEIASALQAGEAVAHALIAKGLIHAAALHLRGVTRIVGDRTRSAELNTTDRSLIHA